MSTGGQDREQAKRPPRVIGWRLLATSVVLGFVLAVLGVLVCAVSPWSAGIRARPPTPARHWHWFEPGHAILYTERKVAGLAISGYSMVPVQPGQQYIFVPQAASNEHSGGDRRPPWAVAPFGGNNEVVVAVASGWPWHAASGQDRWLQQLGAPRTHVSQAKFELGGQHYRLPLIPMWFGLAANTIFYTPFALGGLIVLSLARRTRRRRKCRCVACNYDLTSIPGPCPECGTLDPRLAKRTA